MASNKLHAEKSHTIRVVCVCACVTPLDSPLAYYLCAYNVQNIMDFFLGTIPIYASCSNSVRVRIYMQLLHESEINLKIQMLHGPLKVGPPEQRNLNGVKWITRAIDRF